MKKILLTLFAVAAVVIACDKDALDQDVNNINVLEQAEEINASVDLDTDAIIGSIIERWTGDGLSVPSSKKGTASTARTTTTIDCVEDTRDGLTIDGETDYISYEIAVINGRNFGIARSDADSPLGAFTPLVTVYFVNKGSNNVNIVVNGAVVNSFNNAGFIPLFANGAPLNGGYVENLNAAFIYLTPGTLADAGVACTAAVEADWSESPSTPGLWEHATYGSYQLSNAPFPLSGVLARVMSEGTDVSGTLNYAASGSMTDNAAVREAIENDFEN